MKASSRKMPVYTGGEGDGVGDGVRVGVRVAREVGVGSVGVDAVSLVTAAVAAGVRVAVARLAFVACCVAVAVIVGSVDLCWATQSEM